MIKGGNLVLFDHPPIGKIQIDFPMTHRDINGVQCNISGNTHMFKHLDTFKDFFSWKTNQGVYLSNIYNSYNSHRHTIDSVELQIDEFINYVKVKLDILALDHRVLNNHDIIIKVKEQGKIFDPPHYVYSNNGISIRYSSYESKGKQVIFKLISIYAVTPTKRPLYKPDVNWKLQRGDTDIMPGKSRYIDSPQPAIPVNTAWGIRQIFPPSPQRHLTQHALDTALGIREVSPQQKKSSKKKGKKSKGGSISKKKRHFTKKNKL